MEPYGNSQSDQTRNDSGKNKSYAIKLTGVSHGKKQHFSQTISKKAALKNAPKNDTTFSHASKKQTNFSPSTTKIKPTSSNSNNLGR